MQKPDELSRWLYDLMHFIFYARKSVGIMRRLSKPTNKYERKVMWVGLFEIAINNSKVAVVIRLCIVFQNSRNQKRNIFKLFDLIRTLEFKDPSFKDELLITVELLKVELEKHRDLIQKLVNCRNKIYAHLDPEPNLKVIELEELEELVNLAVKIFDELCLKIYGDTYDLKVKNFYTAEPVIKALVRDYKNQLKRKQLKTQTGV